MKKIKKLSFVLAIALFISIPCISLAAVCGNAPDGVHHFSDHQLTGTGFTRPNSHVYTYGYDENHNAILRTCYVTNHYAYCMYKCSYCSVRNEDAGTHAHYQYSDHSENH